MTPIKADEGPAGLVKRRPGRAVFVAAVMSLIGTAGVVFNAWYDHRSARYESDAINPYLGYHVLAAAGIVIGGLLLLTSAVLAAGTAARTSRTWRDRTTGSIIAAFSVAVLVIRYRYHP